MTFSRGSLKSCTHANIKHDVGPRCGQIKQTPNHGSIRLLVNRIAALIKIKMSICSHRCLDRFSILHTKFLQYILHIFRLTHKCAFLELLDLKSKKETQFTDHRHFKFPRHHVTKFLTKTWVSRTKDNIININLTNKQVFLNRFSEQCSVNLPNFEALRNKKVS